MKLNNCVSHININKSKTCKYELLQNTLNLELNIPTKIKWRTSISKTKVKREEVVSCEVHFGIYISPNAKRGAMTGLLLGGGEACLVFFLFVCSINITVYFSRERLKKKKKNQNQGWQFVSKEPHAVCEVSSHLHLFAYWTQCILPGFVIVAIRHLNLADETG